MFDERVMKAVLKENATFDYAGLPGISAQQDRLRYFVMLGARHAINIALRRADAK